MISAAVLVNIAFTRLGMVFDYPDVLKHAAANVLASFRAEQGAVSAWFLLLALGAALLAPVAVGVGRLSDAPAMRWAVRAGVAAAVVRVVGLLRWPLLVPGWAASDVAGDPVAAAAARGRSRRPTECSGTWSARPAATCSPPRGPRSCSPRSEPRLRDGCSSPSARCRRR